MAITETDFLHGLCNSILNVANSVRFAGIIDNTGRLLVGKYRPDIKAPLIKANASSTIGKKEEDLKATSFYSAYEILLKQMKFQSDLGHIHFQLTEFDKVTLISIPLNSDNDRCLCISIDGRAEYDVIVKILNIIG